MKGRWVQYSIEELTYVRDNCTLPRVQLYAAFVARFNRPDVTCVLLTALRKRNGWLTERNGRYPKGAVPHNKGKRMPFNAASAATQFKAGHLPRNSRYEGHERLCKFGYVEISVTETNPHTGFERRYVLKHLHLWKQLSGPLPVGMCLKCLDGNRQNTDPSNWVAIPRAMLPRLSGRFGRGFETAPADIKPAIMAVTRLEHAVRQKRKAGA